MSDLDLRPGGLRFRAFEAVRKLGGRAADGQTITHDGQQYGLTVQLACDLKVHLVTIEQLQGPIKGYQTTMALADLNANDLADVPGLGLAIDALVSGQSVQGSDAPGSGLNHIYRVMPHVAVRPHHAGPAADNAASDAE